MQLKFYTINTKPYCLNCNDSRLKSRKACLLQIKEVVLKCKNITTKSLARAFVSFKESSQVIFAWFFIFLPAFFH